MSAPRCRQPRSLTCFEGADHVSRSRLPQTVQHEGGEDGDVTVRVQPNCYVTGNRAYHYGVRRTTLCLVFVAVLCTSCTNPTPAEPETVAVVRSLGTFSGRGSQTIGVVSESGHLRVSWQTHNEQPAGTGTFRLALHSGVSGRPIDLITDQRGEVRGTKDVADDPRPYNLMVDSQNLDWTFTVEEIVSARVRP
jgi:hypothetical protein